MESLAYVGHVLLALFFFFKKMDTKNIDIFKTDSTRNRFSFFFLFLI